MKKLKIIALMLFTFYNIKAQESTKINITGYLETYYSYDFNEPLDHNRPSFIYSHNRHNEVNLNLGFIKANFNSEKVRANMALMAGTYANANLSAEPSVLKNIFEANAGLKLTEKANLWLDAGILTSHIGFESAISKDCWVLTRTISSENTPYYETGAKITFITNDGKLTTTALYLNGWQKIKRSNGNNKPAAGLQLTLKPTANLTLNYSNYLGTEGDSISTAKRFYNNFYAIAQLSNRFGITIGFDYATQQNSKNKSQKSKVLSPVLIAQFKLDPKWTLAGRAEYYDDKDGVFISTGTSNGFKTLGYSLNIDYLPISNAIVRLEGKIYDSKDKIFVSDASSKNYNAALTASIAVSF